VAQQDDPQTSDVPPISPEPTHPMPSPDPMPSPSEPVMTTISEDTISSNGHMVYKKTEKVSIANLGNAPVCSICSGMLVFAEGCMKCETCGYSKCG
jgi:hypothetical protein